MWQEAGTSPETAALEGWGFLPLSRSLSLHQGADHSWLAAIRKTASAPPSAQGLCKQAAFLVGTSYLMSFWDLVSHKYNASKSRFPWSAGNHASFFLLLFLKNWFLNDHIQMSFIIALPYTSQEFLQDESHFPQPQSKRGSRNTTGPCRNQGSQKWPLCPLGLLQDEGWRRKAWGHSSFPSPQGSFDLFCSA